MSSLIKVSETNITSSVSSATITGIDTTYDVYMVRFNNIVLSSAGTQIRLRFTVSGTGDSSAKYDYAFTDINAGSSTFAHTYNRDNTYGILDNTRASAGRSANGIIYCYGFNISTEYSWVNNVNSIETNNPYIRARNGGQCLKVNQACDGLEFYVALGTMDSGDIIMYGLKKS